MEPAFRILDAIASGGSSTELSGEGHWIDALKTICWISESGSGFRLTSEGRRAHKHLATELRAARRQGELA